MHNGKNKFRSKEKCKVVKLSVRENTTKQMIRIKSTNKFNDSTIPAGNKIIELDDGDDYELNTNLIAASARVAAENTVINKFIWNDLDSLVPGLQWEPHSSPSYYPAS